MARSDVLLSDAVEGFFITAHARRLAPGTLSDYDNTFRRFEAFLDGPRAMSQITAGEIEAFLSSLKGLSKKTVRNYHIGLSALWTWAVDAGLVKANIVRSLKAPKPQDPNIVPYSEQDVQAMLRCAARTQGYSRPGKRACSNARPSAQRDRAIILFLLDTGVRASELCYLRIADLDLTNRRATVLGKGDKKRTVSFCAQTAEAVWRYLASRDEKVPRSPVFVTRTGRGLDRNYLRQMLQRIGERAGVHDVTVHRFRHTFAIQFLRNHPNVFALKEMLGHETLLMVNRYLEIAQADVEAAHREASPVANWAL
ncbi:MAG: tyrosine-type recombinase/integrase [Anaerolineae bacterium]|nr:tyrosine-type recombinase/integrase [Anaerolineae bacterium]